MSIRKVLLDTDTLSAVMKKHPLAFARAKAYLKMQRRFTFSIITRYEVLRGLKAKHAIVQLADFERLCQTSRIIPLTDDIVICAADIYAALKQRGTLINDADILIAASALEYELTVVTNNEAHFARIDGLNVANWLKAEQVSDKPPNEQLQP